MIAIYVVGGSVHTPIVTLPGTCEKGYNTALRLWDSFDHKADLLLPGLVVAEYRTDVDGAMLPETLRIFCTIDYVTHER